MRAREQYALWNVSRGSVPVLYLTAAIALQLTHHLNATTALMAHYASALALAGYMVYRFGTEPRLAVGVPAAKSVLALGIQHHMISVGQLVNQRFDQFLLVALVGTIQLGYYAVAVTYASLALTIALAPAWHLFSHASQSGSIRRKEFRSLQRRTVLGMLLVAAVGSIATPFLISMVFGPTFAPAVVPAQILLFGGPALALSALRAAAWKASGRPLPAALAEGAGILVTLGGLLLFAPRFGIVAAAGTSIVAYSLVSALLLLRSAPAVTDTAYEGDGSSLDGGDLELSVLP
jgi:O-antigen/teichoic acid export membrane protein